MIKEKSSWSFNLLQEDLWLIGNSRGETFSTPNPKDPDLFV